MTAPPQAGEWWTLHKDPYGVMIRCFTPNECKQTGPSSGYTDHIEVVPAADGRAERMKAVVEAAKKLLLDMPGLTLSTQAQPLVNALAALEGEEKK